MDNKQKDRVALLEKHLNAYFITARDQRDEISLSYLYMSHYNTALKKQKKPDLNASWDGSSDGNFQGISLAPAIINGISGNEAMQERNLDVVPIDNADYDAEADIMDDCVECAQYMSEWREVVKQRKRDAFICGIGATAIYLDTTSHDNISGDPVCQRVDPQYLFFDNSGRGRDINKSANWCGYGDPMTIEDLHEYIEEKLGKKGEHAGTPSSFYAQFTEAQQASNQPMDMLHNATVIAVESRLALPHQQVAKPRPCLR